MAYADITDPRNREAKRRHYRNNKDQYLDRNAKAKAEKVAWLREQKDVPCADCKRRYPHYVMDFDHLDPAVKDGNIGKFITYGWKRLMAEVAKCEVVCSNCHRERTHSQREAGVL